MKNEVEKTTSLAIYWFEVVKARWVEQVKRQHRKRISP